ncbi:MAG: hypothetical protein ACHQF4_07930 [Sphingobacteriales bacterium]
MKKALYLFAIVASFASCKNGSKTAGSTTDSVVMPYKATYSSSFVKSDSINNIKAVLQSFKDWEDNKLANAPAYFADTVSEEFWNGLKFTMKRDSMVKVFQKYRDSLSSSKIDVVAYAGLHSTDKNTDWVCIWYKQTDTYKTGKVDSAYYEDDNEMVKGKIAFINDKRRELKPYLKK